MRLLSTLSLSLLCCLSTTVFAGPPLQGPAIHNGAWETTHSWSDSAAGPGDRSQGSYAYAYQAWARERADRHVLEKTELDCADLSIALLCEYAGLNGLPVRWRVYYPAEQRFLRITNSDAQFDSPESFSAWSQYYLGAINLADNTTPITYEEWAGGDMVLMDWNQDETLPNFPGRSVWHTYLIGTPGELVYYGNISNGQPLPVVSTSSSSTLSRVREHPDRYGFSPRRYSMFKDALWEPKANPSTLATVIRAHRLNLRQGPSTGQPVLDKALRGESFEVIGSEGRWVQLELADGRQVWAHGYYLKVEELPAPLESAGLSLALGGVASSLAATTTTP